MKKIVCIGQTALDITLPVKNYPIENTKNRIGDSRLINGGGAVNNAAYLLGKWHNDVTLLSSVGNDNDSIFLEKEMNDIGVKTIFSKIDNVSTTTSYIITNLSNSSRTIITNKNPNLEFKGVNDINILADYILFDGNEYELAKKVINDNREAIKVIDAGSNKLHTMDIAKLCDYIVASSDFASEYTGIKIDYNNKDNLNMVYNKIQEELTGTLVITLEEHGCMVKINGELIIIPTIKVNSVDSNGAGDIFHGAFIHFLANGYSLVDTLRLSNITGALSTRFLGTRNSIPDIMEVINYDK